MKISKVTAIYFSATNISKKYAKAIAKGVSENVFELDITLPCSREATVEPFTSSDLVIVAMPVYAGRVVGVAVPFIQKLKGNNTPCIIVATYGNRHFDDALVELEDTLTTQGFNIVGAAATVGRHSFSSEISGDRPNSTDLEGATEFGKKVALKQNSTLEKGEILGNRPYKDGMGINQFYSTVTDDCVNCKLCAKQCPMGVISLTNVRELVKEPTECIMCNRCVVNCPKGARVFDFEPYKQMTQRCITNFANPQKENIYIL